MCATTSAMGDPRETKPPGPPVGGTRRRFFRLLSRALLGLWGVGAVAGIGRFLNPPSHQHRRNEVVVPAEEIEKLAVGHVLLVPHSPDPIHLVRLSEDEFLALSASCTHLRCILDYDVASRNFVCPCHSGLFDLNGNVIAGLPRTPLPRYRSLYRFGEVVIEST